jgi:hypothetical protein
MFEGPHDLKMPAPKSDLGESTTQVATEAPRFHRKTLKDFAEHPLLISEVSSRGEYYAQFHNDIAGAIIFAGFDPATVSELMRKSFDRIDFTQPAEKFVDDINRLINDLSKTQPDTLPVVIEKPDRDIQAASALVPEQTVESTLSPAIPAVETNLPSAASLQQQIEELEQNNFETAIAPLQLTDATRVEVNQPIVALPLEPLVLDKTKRVPDPDRLEALVLDKPLPDTLILSPEQQVLKETVGTPESSTLLKSESQQQLEALNEKPFDRNAYLEFTFEKHSELRAKYDAVLQKARENLSSNSPLHRPSKTEKQALL